MKAADIPDVDILREIERQCHERGHWTNSWDVAAAFPAFPFKVVQAKLRRLLGRDLVTGCGCGCRGDWELRAKGRELAGIAGPWRETDVRDDAVSNLVPNGDQR